MFCVFFLAGFLFMAVPNTFQPNTQIKSAQVNENFTYITDLIDEVGGDTKIKTTGGTLIQTKYKARAYLSGSDQTGITNGTKITLNAENYDPNNNFDISTDYDYTVPVDGLYLLAAGGYILGGSSSSSHRHGIAIRINGTDNVAYGIVHLLNSRDAAVSACTVESLSQGDVITLHGATSDSFGLNAGIETFLSIHLLSVD